MNTLKDHIREETACITVCGNHEFKHDNYEEMFEKHFTHGLNTITEINGFTVGKDILEKGKTYTLTVTAVSGYKLKSEAVSMVFTA